MQPSGFSSFSAPFILRPIGTALLAALFWPAVASAHRTAPKAETSAMIYTASGRYYGNLNVAVPRSVPLRCFTADISTVVNGAGWGAWTAENSRCSSSDARPSTGSAIDGSGRRS